MTRRLRLLIIVVFLGVSLWFLYPTFKWYFELSEVQRREANASRDQIRILSQIRAKDDIELLIKSARNDTDSSLPEELDYLTGIATERLSAEKREIPKAWSIKEIVKSFPGQAETTVAIEDYHREKLLELKDLRSQSIQLGLDLSGGMYVVIQPDIDSLNEQMGGELNAQEEDYAIRRALEVLNNRIDQFGVTEPQIRRRGDGQIVVEMPGAPDPERMRSFILGKGRLNFHIVDNESFEKFREYQGNNPSNYIGADGKLIDNNILSAGTVLRGRYEKDAYGVDELRGYTVIREEVGLEGKYIQRAQVSQDPITQQPTVVFNLSNEGADIFFKLTSDNVGNLTLCVYAYTDEPLDLYKRYKNGRMGKILTGDVFLQCDETRKTLFKKFSAPHFAFCSITFM